MRRAGEVEAKNDHVPDDETMLIDKLFVIPEIVVPDVVYSEPALLIEDDVGRARATRADEEFGHVPPPRFID